MKTHNFSLTHLNTNMPKRFTYTQKWQDEWFMELPAKYKLFYLYLLDNCDHAGIWKVNMKLATFHIGDDLNIDEIKNLFGNRILEFKDGYFFIVKFIQFQYGGLKNDAVGKSVYKILETNNLLGAMEGLPSPLVGTKVKDKVKVIENNNSIKVPFSDFFIPYWERWKEYKSKEHKFKYKSEHSETSALNDLFKLSNSNEQTAIAIIEQSIANGWKGFFQLKNQTNGKKSSKNVGAYELLDELRAEYKANSSGYGFSSDGVQS